MEHLDPHVQPQGLPPPQDMRDVADVHALASAEALTLKEGTPIGAVPLVRYLDEAKVGMIALASEGAPPELSSLVTLAIAATFSGNNQMAIIKDLCTRGVSLNTPDPATGLTPLGYAVKNAKTFDDIVTIKELVKLGADIDAKDASGATAWMQAGMSSNVPLMKWLKNQGADVYATDNLGRSALMRAFDANASKETLSHIINVAGVNPEQKDNGGLTAFGYAVRSGDEKALQFIAILEEKKFDVSLFIKAQGLEPQEALSEYRRVLPEKSQEEPFVQESSSYIPDTFKNLPENALLLAVQYGSDPKLISFLTLSGANLHAKDQNGNSFLHVAIERNQQRIAVALLDAGANLNEPNILGQTPLDLATILQHTELSTLLVERGAAIRQNDLTALRDSYKERISLSPPFPRQGINDPQSRDNQERFADFVAAHSHYTSDALPEALENVIAHTDYISFSEFLEHFNAVIDQLNQQIGEKEEYIILIEPKKSNKWLAELAFAKLQTPPKDIVRMNDLEESLHMHTNVARVVLLDDASYSGEQMCRFVREKAASALSHADRQDFTINVAVPFLTKVAETKIAAINTDEEVQGRGKIVISDHKIMEAADLQIPEAYHKVLTKHYFPQLELKEMLSLADLLNQTVEQLQIAEDILHDLGFEESELFHSVIFPAHAIMTAHASLTTVEQYEKMMEDKEISEGVVPLVSALTDFWESKQEALEELLGQPFPKETYTVIKHLMYTIPLMIQYLKEQQFDNGLKSRTLTIFDHKVADQLSTCPGFENGEVYINGDPVDVLEIFVGKAPYKKDYL